MARRACNIANALMFQLAWFVCVQGRSDWALVATLLALILHWRFAVTNPREWKLWLAVLLLGFCVDTALIAVGVLHFPHADLMPPPWLLCIWIMFASTLLHSLAFLQRSLLLSACLGAVGGPLAYYAGTRFGTARLGGSEWIALVVLAACWSLIMPLLMLLAKYVESLHELHVDLDERKPDGT